MIPGWLKMLPQNDSSDAFNIVHFPFFAGRNSMLGCSFPTYITRIPLLNALLSRYELALLRYDTCTILLQFVEK